jgi:hypothetical protein
MSIKIEFDADLLNRREIKALSKFLAVLNGEQCDHSCATQDIKHVDAGLNDIPKTFAKPEPIKLGADGAKECGLEDAPNVPPVTAVADPLAMFNTVPVPLTAGVAPSPIAPTVLPAANLPGVNVPLPNAAANVQPANAPTAPVPPTNPVNVAEYDSAGMPWDARIHAKNKGKKQDGTWRNGVGVDPEVKKAVELELKGQTASPQQNAYMEFIKAIGPKLRNEAAPNNPITEDSYNAILMKYGATNPQTGAPMTMALQAKPELIPFVLGDLRTIYGAII